MTEYSPIMTPLVLEGYTLGEKHRHYNKLLKEAIAINSGAKLSEISYDGNELDNLMKIDIAGHNQDLFYILQVLRSKDLHYVNRAIKKSKWLFTDNKYSHVINPKYLNEHLFPYMMLKAKFKLILHIRLHLRDEKRVVQFYNYFKQFDKNSAMKWLEHCPLNFALKEVYKNGHRLTRPVLKRLCRKSFDFLEKFAASGKVTDWIKDISLGEVQFLIRHNTEKYLNIIDSCSLRNTPKIENKYLKIIMKTCPQRILNNFLQYLGTINYLIVATYMAKESVKPFLLECSLNNDLHEFVRCHYLMKDFLPKIDYHDRIEVLKSFYDKTSGINCEGPDGLNLLFSAMVKNEPFNSPKVFDWYQCMPFEIAYQEMTKLIQKELRSDVRLSMIITLLTCAGYNFDNLSIVLKYYHDEHINEAYKFKVKFINEFLSRVATYKFDIEMWSILDNLFCSLEVYMNSKLNVTKCVEAIIVYNTIHNQIVPETVESKFKFETLKSYKNKLSAVESNKLFIFLYNNQLKNIEKTTVANADDLKVIVKSLENSMKLLTDWNKNIVDFPVLLGKIREYIKVRKQHSWDVDMSSLYDINKHWRKHLFDHSLMINPSKTVLMNVLKHDPNMMTTYKNEVDLIRYDNTISLRSLLSKLKIFWSDTLAIEWANEYLQHLNETGKQKVAIQSLAILLPQKDFLDLAKKYIPEKNKIDWRKADELEFSSLSYFAINIHRVRPYPDTETALLFAKCDHLQFSLTSLGTMLANISYVDREQYLSKLTNVPVSLQKHVIRMVIAKLPVKKLVPIFETIWKSTTKPTIRTNLFLITHRLLCKQTRRSDTLRLWSLLEMFIENLSNCENGYIYRKVCNISKIPAIVKPEYCRKAYLYLKTLPETFSVQYTDQMMNYNTPKMLEILDGKFIEEVILGSIDDFRFKSTLVVNFFARYLLSIKNEQTESDTYERLVKPLFYNIGNYTSENFKLLMEELSNELCDSVSINGTVPVNLFKNLLNSFIEKLLLPEDYIALKNRQLTSNFVETIERHISPTVKKSGNIDDILTIDMLADYGRVCLTHLQETSENYAFPIDSFHYALGDVLSELKLSNMHKLQILKHMLVDETIVESYFVVHKLLPETLWLDEENKLKDEIKEILCSHPSKEFQMICRHDYQNIIQGRSS